MRDETKFEPTSERPDGKTAISLARAIDVAKAERAFYQAGRAAYRGKQNEAACPYPGSSARAKLWLQGFAEVKDAEERKRARFL